MRCVMTVGVSASGKSSFAGEYNPCSSVIERDSFRFGVVCKDCTGWKGKKPYKFTQQNEQKVSDLVEQAVLFAAQHQEDIILSDTWLNKKNRLKMYEFVKGLGYNIKVVVFEVPLKIAIERDSYREDFSVGEDIIRSQWDKFQGAKSQLLAEKDLYNLEVVYFENYKDYKWKELG